MGIKTELSQTDAPVGEVESMCYWKSILLEQENEDDTAKLSIRIPPIVFRKLALKDAKAVAGLGSHIDPFIPSYAVFQVPSSIPYENQESFKVKLSAPNEDNWRFVDLFGVDQVDKGKNKRVRICIQTLKRQA
jgi:hypothetical protein